MPNSASGTRATAAKPGHKRLRLIAQVLPLLTLISWTVTLWVPVLDSAGNSLHTGESVRIVVTSLGHGPRDFTDLDPDFVVIWSCLLACVVSAWLIDSLRLWSLATTALGVVVLWFLVDLLAEPPTLMWDGQDGDGQWIGGMEVASPDVGAAFWALGGIALAVAGICGLCAESLRGNALSNALSNCRGNSRPHDSRHNTENPQISRLFATEPSRDGSIRVRRHRSAAERLARQLPVVSVAAWVVMIWVPIFANHASDDERVTLTSLGAPPVSMGDLGLDVILPWLVVLCCAAVSWFMDPPLWWSVMVILFGIVLLIMLEVSMFDPPTAHSVINYSSGESREVTIAGFPDAGVGYWNLGSGALVCAGAAGIAGHLGERRRRSFRQLPTQ